MATAARDEEARARKQAQRKQITQRREDMARRRRPKVHWDLSEMPAGARLRPAAARAQPTMMVDIDGVQQEIMAPGPPASPLVMAAAAEPPLDIVQKYAAWSVVGGLLPWPFIDIAFLTAVEYRMILELSEYYGQPVTNGSQKVQDVLSALLTALIPNSFVAGVPGQLVRMIPLVGNALSFLTQPGFAVGVTYLLGWIAISNLQAGGTAMGTNNNLYQQIQDTAGSFAEFYGVDMDEMAA
jgi:uncharacterized protein (DUF697 family)